MIASTAFAPSAASIDKLPAEERTWVLLRLKAAYSFDCVSVATESELVSLCKRLGPDKLLQACQGRVFSDDPDARQGDGVGLVLHARELLRPGRR